MGPSYHIFQKKWTRSNCAILPSPKKWIFKLSYGNSIQNKKKLLKLASYSYRIVTLNVIKDQRFCAVRKTICVFYCNSLLLFQCIQEYEYDFFFIIFSGLPCWLRSMEKKIGFGFWATLARIDDEIENSKSKIIL